MAVRKLVLALVLAASLVAVIATAASAGGGPANLEPQVLDDSSMTALTATEGGADVLPTTKTVPHWFGTTTNPDNGITYGYNMVGADPNTCSGSACSTTIQTDITPINVVYGPFTFNATGDVLNATLASPVFALNDYGSTPNATAQDVPPLSSTHPRCDTTKGDICLPRGPGGALSQGDAGNSLQLQDATMRAQFNKTGNSPYHLILHPNVQPAVTLTVPQNQGALTLSGRGVLFLQVSINWWSAQIKQLETTADPTHLPLYLSNNILLFIGKPGNCCVIGYHGTKATGKGNGSANSNGDAPVQTFAWASYVQPGIYARPAGGTDWALQDIHALSHEIAEWADDPFVNNWVEPWLTPTAPQYGCTNILETGDPVVSIGFAMGTNTYLQTPNPWTSPANHTPSVSYDGFYHPEDEVFLPWFMRTSPNNVSEPNQTTGGGRYTLMGDLNPFPGFHKPATGC
jgi:hypothetical protein